MNESKARRPFSAERRAHLKPTQGIAKAVDGATPPAGPADETDTAQQFALLRAELAEIKLMIRETGTAASDAPEAAPTALPPSDEEAQLSEEALTIQAVQVEIAQMVKSIARAKAEIAAIKHPMAEDDRLIAASNELDAIVSATELATTDILSAAEAIELEAAGIAGLCHDDQDVVTATERIVAQVVKILEASNFQDITGQRITKVVETVRYIEERILTMIDIWGVDAFGDLPMKVQGSEGGDDDLLNGPQLENQGISQADIDALFD